MYERQYEIPQKQHNCPELLDRDGLDKSEAFELKHDTAPYTFRKETSDKRVKSSNGQSAHRCHDYFGYDITSANATLHQNLPIRAPGDLSYSTELTTVTSC